MNAQTIEIDLFGLFTVRLEDVLRQGGAYVEIMNQRGDGVLYIPVGIAELVIQTLSNQPMGERQ